MASFFFVVADDVDDVDDVDVVVDSVQASSLLPSHHVLPIDAVILSVSRRQRCIVLNFIHL